MASYWFGENKGLTERDLNIPSGKKTNPTGSMLWKKGAAAEEVDQRHFFREDIFAKLDWQVDPKLHTTSGHRPNSNSSLKV